MAVDVFVVTITPELAKNWLEKNKKNFRRLDKKRSAKYQMEMKLGRWQLNGETVKFDCEGNLIDGQHRLDAIVNSGVTVKSFVAHDVDACPSSLDRGRPRTIAQFLTSLGFKNATAIAAVARTCVAHEKGLWHFPSWSSDSFADSEVIEFALKHDDSLQDAVLQASRFKLIPRSVLASILFLGSGKKRCSQNEISNWFIESLSSGVDLSENDPVLLLRNRMVSGKERTAKLSSYMTRMLATVAWNKTVLGESLKVLKITMTGPAKSSLPTKVLIAEAP